MPNKLPIVISNDISISSYIVILSINVWLFELKIVVKSDNNIEQFDIVGGWDGDRDGAEDGVNVSLWNVGESDGAMLG